MKKMYDELTHMYPLQKTLRFELIPQGKTLENITKNGIITEDTHRKESYAVVKELIDEYHKYFIDKALRNAKLEGLQEYYEAYNSDRRIESNKKNFDNINSKLRKQITSILKVQPEFQYLFKKELITKYLPDYYETQGNIRNIEVINEFSKFTTYFNNYFENRKNMYTDEEKSTGIAYRLINDNLPMFVTNMKEFSKVKDRLSSDAIKELEMNLELIMQTNNIEEMFEIDYFNETLTQKGIEIYNNIIGGYTDKEGKKYKGLNEYINEYNQISPNNEKIGKMKTLYKQILSDRIKLSFVLEKYETDQQVLKSVHDVYIELSENLFNGSDMSKNIIDIFNNIKNSNTKGIFIKNDLLLSDISKKFWGDWQHIQNAILSNYEEEMIKNGKKIQGEKYEKQKKNYFKNIKSFSLAELNSHLKKYDMDCIQNIEDYFINGIIEKIKNINASYDEMNVLIEERYPSDRKLIKDSETIEKIKNYLDSIKELQNFIKPLLGNRDENDRDTKFYTDFMTAYEKLSIITDIYNKIRNYVTQKPYSTEKIKLNFNCSSFLNSWSLGYATKAAIIFKKKDKFYIGIINKKFTLENINKLENIQNSDYKRINMVVQKPDYKNTPRLFIRSSGKKLAPAVEKYNLPINDIINIYDDKKFTTEYKNNNNDEYREALKKIIDYFKIGFSKHEDYKNFNFLWKDSKEYTDINQFYEDTIQSCYKITEKAINEETLNEYVDSGKIYLFQIYNKDFSEHSTGKPNLHTLYFRMLFDEKNLKKNIYKLDGNAEIFYREKSIRDEDIIRHAKNVPIKNKNKTNDKKESEFEYDLIKDRRYTVDKFQVHLPITLNFNNKGETRINNKVNELIKTNDKNYVIGIDRGERHLLYLSLIDQNGNIVEQYSLNDIINEYNKNTYTTQYHKLLDEKEKSRESARENWQTIENIKELKEGYLSQAISKITDLMVKYNAIVVLEDLNFGFMRGRQKFEKQVYQKFEKMLIDKLNYLCKKNIDIDMPGGILNAYQLTNRFESFKKLENQSGVLFYIPAWNTSKMDPTTGFVNLFYLKYENIEKSKSFFEKFDNIVFNKTENYFEFDIDYSKFTDKTGKKKNWKICSNDTRIENFRNHEKNDQWDSREINLTNEFINLFDEYDIDYMSNNLKQDILTIQEAKFYERMIHLFKLTVQMRNSMINSEVDYLISPIKNKDGKFFDSRKSDESLPKNADANGAYNIARKGLWVIEQIKQTDDLGKIKLAISNKEWLDYIQK